jgi:hypothetical protein
MKMIASAKDATRMAMRSTSDTAAPSAPFRPPATDAALCVVLVVVAVAAGGDRLAVDTGVA